MAVRIATFNTENLFRRPSAFRLPDAAARKRVLKDFAGLVALLDKKTYTARDKDRISALVLEYRAYSSDPENPPLIYVNQNRPGTQSGLFTTPAPGTEPTELPILAEGRGSWAGWAELGQDDLDMAAVSNTGRVVREVNADVLLVPEVEDRLTLDRFNQHVLGLGWQPYPFNLLIDGNDPRGIDIGILSRLPITSVRTHIFETDPADPTRPLFSRDCPEFEIRLGSQTLVVLGNHLKSKFNDEPELRLAQAERVAEIYRAALERTPDVVVAGDLNDTPDSKPVGVLLDTGLRDVMSHPLYDGEPGTHGNCHHKRDKLDYVMLPPALWSKVQRVGLETRGIAAHANHFKSVHDKTDEASDHAALYVDLDVNT
ncbi:endonuclease/exonuclease/phosphatase family protein [Streptomyces actinomycinicus]|uniref:Endonuclease/exonuclease/phosphatase family protein n=1 Tax=Streptomyces actinomycinicus TaxID=1695166 RepID=A0A937EEU4_9ACTN|nr:endonuclease/exonuclease/phosphatase family protein [Streptomyces actinomycinicus]MBL1080840.1 endonuclease/exonuclease/phosphatase family protein [Streptomyces actinomycinicus]